MRIDHTQQLNFDDVLILPKRSTLESRNDVDITRQFTFKHSGFKFSGVPIICANMSMVGNFKMASALYEHKMMTCLHKFYAADELADFFNTIEEDMTNFVFYTIGMRDQDLEQFNYVKTKTNNKIKLLCIDVPSAYIEKFVEFVKKVRAENPTIGIMAGNVCTHEMAEQIFLAGADLVKVGIAGGSACTTAKVAGCGRPQLSTIMDCADYLHGLDGLCCSDGGIVNPADIGKAIGAGSDFVMVGGILSGHDECDSELIDEMEEVKGLVQVDNELKVVSVMHPTGRKFMRFFGMSSSEAQKTHYQEVKNYRASEGRSLLVPYKGSVHDTIREYLGGLRSTMTYVGAAKLKELSKRTTFIVVNKTLNTSLEKFEKK